VLKLASSLILLCLYFQISKVFGIFKSLEKYAKGRIEEHRETFDPDNIRDFVDLFLKNEGGNGDDAINGMCLSL
jgi:hypothetical protein